MVNFTVPECMSCSNPAKPDGFFCAACLAASDEFVNCLTDTGYEAKSKYGGIVYGRSDSLYELEVVGSRCNVWVNGRPDEPCKTLEDLKGILDCTPKRKEFWAMVLMPDEEGDLNLGPTVRKFWIGVSRNLDQLVIGTVDKEMSQHGWLFRDFYHQPINPDATKEWNVEMERVTRMVVEIAARRMADGVADWDSHLWDLGFRP